MRSRKKPGYTFRMWPCLHLLFNYCGVTGDMPGQLSERLQPAQNYFIRFILKCWL